MKAWRPWDSLTYPQLEQGRVVGQVEQPDQPGHAGGVTIQNDRVWSLQVRVRRNEPPVFDRRRNGLAHATMLDRGRLCY